MSTAPSPPEPLPPAAPLRLAIVSDTHFPRRGALLPDDVLPRLRAADAIVHAGDLCDVATLEQLRAIGPPVHAVLGNNDRPLVGLLPETLTIELGGRRIGVIHDGGERHGRMRRLRRRFPGHDAVIFGHSHVPEHRTDPDDGFQIFNPGSLTDRRHRWPVHTFGEAEVGADGVRFALVERDG
ncbi:metallophosphoesterase family protein [Patulibacter defluvii]|uniref:metallophosphoesterase family protein n=1 Tax=Patulibacter defluvii TaxID=3095358 RepID=UPI002A7553CF|nr:metallophosphoesterase family protein [Patulibacter sp. DM4]